MKLRSMSSGMIIALCFLCVIVLGTLLLLLPFSQTGVEHVSLLDALFTSVSATCVTGLVVVDPGTVFTGFGQAVILAMIQAGGLGAATLGISVTLLIHRRLSFKDAVLIKESWNINSLSNLRKLMRTVLLMTVGFELTGALLCLTFFARYMPFGKAVWTSIFHSVSAFNNAGFDIFGQMRSLTVYGDAPAINLITAGLIIFSGLGYLVLIDVFSLRKRFRQFSLQSKVVLCTTAFLLVFGTLMLRLTEEISWMGAFFQSVATRTAGFCSWDLTAFTPAGHLIMCMLMFVGTSPGSTGGGVKTTTLFALMASIRSSATQRPCQAFRRTIPGSVISRAFTVALMGLLVVFASTLLLCIFEPEMDFMALFFESVSAFSTTGLSLSLTPLLGSAARIVLILTMYIGRLGPLTVATMWAFRQNSSFRYTEESFTIG